MKLTSANTERLCVRLFVWQRSTTLLNIVLLFISHRSWIVATLMQFIHKYRTTFKLIRFFLLQIYLLFVDHAYAKSFTVQIWCLCEKKKEMKTKSNIKSVLEILYFMLILWCSSQNIDRHSGLHVFDMFFIFFCWQIHPSRASNAINFNHLSVQWNIYINSCHFPYNVPIRTSNYFFVAIYPLFIESFIICYYYVKLDLFLSLKYLYLFINIVVLRKKKSATSNYSSR